MVTFLPETFYIINQIIFTFKLYNFEKLFRKDFRCWRNCL